MQNNHYKKTLFLAVFFALSVPFIISAVSIENPLAYNTFQEFINALAWFILQIAVAIAPIMFIFAGFKFVTAVGDPKKIDDAKKMVLWTMVGLGVVFCSYAIINFFRRIFPM